MQLLTEKNTVLSQELEKCKAQLEAALAAAGEPKETPSGKIHFERLVLCGVGANLTNHIADGAGLDPDKQQLLLLGNVVISKNFLRTRKIMVMHSNERGECDLHTLVDRQRKR